MPYRDPTRVRAHFCPALIALYDASSGRIKIGKSRAMHKTTTTLKGRERKREKEGEEADMSSGGGIKVSRCLLARLLACGSSRGMS